MTNKEAEILSKLKIGQVWLTDKWVYDEDLQNIGTARTHKKYVIIVNIDADVLEVVGIRLTTKNRIRDHFDYEVEIKKLINAGEVYKSIARTSRYRVIKISDFVYTNPYGELIEEDLNKVLELYLEHSQNPH